MNKKLIVKTLGALILASQLVASVQVPIYGTEITAHRASHELYTPYIYQEEAKKSTKIGEVLETGDAVNVFSELERNETVKKAYLEQYGVQPISVEDPSWMTGVPSFVPGAPDIDDFPSADALIDGDTDTFWKSFYWPREEKEVYDEEARVVFGFKAEDLASIHSIILRGQDGYESEASLKLEIYESNGPSVWDGPMTKIATIENTQAVADSYIEIPLANQLTKPYVHIRMTGVNGGSHARFTEIGFLKEDTARESIAGLFTESMFVEVSHAYGTHERLDTLANQLEGHLLEESFSSHIQVARAVIDNEVRPDRYAMELEATGDMRQYEREMQLSMRLSNAQPIGYYAEAGSTIDIYVEAGPNGELPKVGFGQVGRIDNESYTSKSYYEKVMEAIGTGQDANLIQLSAGHNQVTLPNVPFGEGRYGRKHPYAIYFSYNGDEDMSGGAKIRVSGDALNPYPVYRYGVDCFENYKEELSNYTGADMTHFITERFQLSTTKTVIDNVLSHPNYDHEVNVEKLDRHTEAIYQFAGIDTEDIKGRAHIAGSDIIMPSGAAAFAGQGIIHTQYGWITNLMTSEYESYYTHEVFHQLANKYLNVWESPQVLSENFVKLILGEDVYTEDTVLIDSYINFLGTKGMSQFDGDMPINQNLEYTLGRYSQDPIFAIPLLYFGEATYGVELYSKAAQLLRSGNHDIPLDAPTGEIIAVDRGDVGQNWLRTFSIVTGYDLRPYFEYFKAPINQVTNNYLDKKLAEGTIKSLDGKMEKLHLVTPKTTIARQEQLPTFTDETQVNLTVTKNGNQLALDIHVNEYEESVLVYEIYKKTNDSNYEFWGVSRNGAFKISQILDTNNPRYIDLSDTHEFYAIAYDYELNATIPSNEPPTNIPDAEETIPEGREALKAILNEANAKNEQEYSIQAWARFIDSKEQLEAIYFDPSATQDDVDHATFIMQLELITLEKAKETPVVDKTQLAAAIKKAEALTSGNYTETTWSILEDQLVIAKNVMEATGKSIDDAHVAKITKNLNDAIATLVLQ